MGFLQYARTGTLSRILQPQRYPVTWHGRCFGRCGLPRRKCCLGRHDTRGQHGGRRRRRHYKRFCIVEGRLHQRLLPQQHTSLPSRLLRRHRRGHGENGWTRIFNSAFTCTADHDTYCSTSVFISLRRRVFAGFNVCRIVCNVEEYT